LAMADKTISQLPQLPGNLTLDAVFAVMQNGVAHKVEAENVFTAITTTSSGTSTCIRIPGAQIQVCYAKLQAVHVGSRNYLRVDEWTYPKAFNSAPALSLQ